jgi:stage II sporulation protein P
MKKNKERILLPVLLPAILLLLGFFALPAAAEREKTDGTYFTIVDENDKVICRTAHYITVGDEYLTAENNLYRIRSVHQNIAHAQLVKKGLDAGRRSFRQEIRRGLHALLRAIFPKDTEPAQGEGERRPIAIYHTHSGESYLPNEGSPHAGAGNSGVRKVGERLARRLEAENIPVIHDTTNHDPQDAMAYDRSRRTVAELLKKRPIALIDLHRDAVPAEEYETWVEGNKAAKIQLVVGRQNTKREANEAFARQVKAAVDREYPGLIKGIFYGSGKYNQDMAPRLLLIEAGSHTNDREEVEKGVELFAVAAHRVLSTAAVSPDESSSSWRNLLWLIGLVAAGVVIFVLLNRGWGKLREE